MREGVNDAQIRRRATALTLALYRVTEGLPSCEPLRLELRNKALEILDAAVGEADFSLPAQSLFAYLKVAESACDLNPVNFVVLARDYRALLDQLALENRKLVVPADPAQPGTTQSNNIVSAGYAAAGFTATRINESARTSAGENSGQSRGTDATLVLNERQRAILARLEEGQQVKISDFYGMFAGVSVKTIQRDLHDLVERNLARREGEKRWTVYLKNHNVR